jgi:hypothetical protein
LTAFDTRCQVEQLVAVARGDAFVSKALDHVAQRLEQRGFVVGDQHQTHGLLLYNDSAG